MRREEADGVVTPVVRQPAFGQEAVGDELVHGHKLHRGDAEFLQVLDDRGMRKPGVGAPLRLRHAGMQLGEAAHVRLVDHRLVVLRPRRAVAAPVEVRVHHHRARHVRRGVGIVALVGVIERVGEHRRIPVDAALDRLRVGVEQQLRRIAAVPGGWIVGPVHPVAVALARPHAGQVTVPDEPVHLAQRQPGLGAVVAEQAQLDLIGNVGVQREVGPSTVVGGPQRVTGTWPCGLLRHSPPSVRLRAVCLAGASRDPWPAQEESISSGVRGVCVGPAAPEGRSVKVTLHPLFLPPLVLQCLQRHRCPVRLGQRWLDYRSRPEPPGEHHVNLGGVHGDLHPEVDPREQDEHGGEQPVDRVAVR